jgi:hypothetical protein
MMRALLSHMSSFRQHAVALFHRGDQGKVDAAERRERWNQVIARHQKPRDQDDRKSTSPSSSAAP